jgi:transcriptional regulator with XRE-family HTH domain
VNTKGLSTISDASYDLVNHGGEDPREITGEPMSISVKLKELRAKKKQSLQQVADGVGVSKAHIWDLERGISANPSLDLLKKLAKHFGVTVAYLADDPTMPSDATPLQFFREFEGKLSDKDWETLRTVAERLKDKDER